jgi:hypothetical protein
MALEVRRASYDGRQDDVGYACPCFQVEDIDAAYREWTSKGYTIHAEPQVTPDGPVEGSKFMILKDRDGKNIEIVETAAARPSLPAPHRAAPRRAGEDHFS